MYVGSASTDPVSYIGTAPEYLHDYLNRTLGYPVGLDAGLGHRPCRRPVRLDPVRRGGGRAATASTQHDHSHYYDMGSESLRAMTYIATGESGELAGEGLLADGRRQPHVDLPTEIDLPFGAKDRPAARRLRHTGFACVHRSRSRSSIGVSDQRPCVLSDFSSAR